MHPQAESALTTPSPCELPLAGRAASTASTEVPVLLPSLCVGSRPRARGKFLWIGDEKLYVRGVTYGPFRPDLYGCSYPTPAAVERDFSQMGVSGFNAVRTYDVPPRWLLDLAHRKRLGVMVGLQVELYASFFDNKNVAREIRDLVRTKVRACAGHPALLCYAIANEVTAPIVRWHGAHRIERFLEGLYEFAKAEDPEGLFCYANYPSTEYLDLPFLDLVCFNVYLESQPKFEAYLARLQNLADNRPLLMTEIGLDSRRSGEVRQAETLEWQIRNTFAAGCAGAFVFAWTDEWHSRGHDVEDWDFGLTDRRRKPKPALAAARGAFADAPFSSSSGLFWPLISVVVCTFNGQRTIRECLAGLRKLEYPNYEVIVVDDGSKDGTAAIAGEYGIRLIRTENRGLSAARNTGFEASTGEIVAYIDDDACPDPEWLNYLASAFRDKDYAGVGGPNIPSPDDGLVASCIAHSPGIPTHVLLSDTEAEHIPGCNMAFRKSWLEAIGGFDPQFRVAGDDVDICWRIRERGGKLGFSPGAMVWHHTRNSVRAFWKQQKGYGKAEALLEKKWPEKYDSLGHITWLGRVYSDGLIRTLERNRGRIYQGMWGSAGFARLYTTPQDALSSLPLMPEWYLIILLLGGLGVLGYDWKPLLSALPLLVLALGVPLAQIVIGASRTYTQTDSRAYFARFRMRMLTLLLHVTQPLARLVGRLSKGLVPWHRSRSQGMSFPRRRTFWLWSEAWQDSTERLESLESKLRANGAVVRRGGDFDHWDLQVRGGIFSDVRILMAEEYNRRQQLVRVRTWTRFSFPGIALAGVFALLSTAAAFDGAWAAATLLGGLATTMGVLLFRAEAGAAATVNRSLTQLHFKE